MEVLVELGRPSPQLHILSVANFSLIVEHSPLRTG
jgi:hypothetical protein